MPETYYAQGCDVFAAPRKTANGTTMGFRVCQAFEPENAAEIARCLNQDDAMDLAAQSRPDRPITRDNQSLGICITGGRMIMAIGTDCLVHAVTQQPALEDFKISDPAAFVAAIAEQLDRELGEDGTTPMHIVFDRAAVNAMEYGCEGLEDTANG